jgi:hypothetical protein
MAYMYNYAGAPWKTQERIHEITTTLYTEKADGLCGNEDCGQMSAWYVFSAMGFYPVCPGSEEYIIGTTLFDKVTISSGGKKFTITANNLSDKNFYIKSARLNGKEYPYSFIRHSDIINGGELIFEMSPEPTYWGKDPDAKPKSNIDIPFIPVPFLTSGERVFRDSVIVEVSTISGSSPSGLGPAETIYYTTDGSSPIINKNVYSGPIVIRNSAILKVVCYNDGNFSKVVTATFNKIPEGRSVKIKHPYSHSYTGGGDLGLIDGIKGNMNFRTDTWQGYEGVDFEAVIDLGKTQKLSLISASFLENTYSWIFFPTLVEYYISSDGNNFTKVYEIKNPPAQGYTEESIKNFSKSLEGIETRFVQVIAQNIGVCPDWHVSPGGRAWIFVDEITVK